jgi:hypothetical protein
VWGVSTILTGLLSFMTGEERTLGSVDAPDAERRRLAAASLAFNASNADFCRLFPDLVERLRSAEAAVDAAGPAAAGAAAARAGADADRGGDVGRAPVEADGVRLRAGLPPAAAAAAMAAGPPDLASTAPPVQRNGVGFVLLVLVAAAMALLFLPHPQPHGL